MRAKYAAAIRLGIEYRRSQWAMCQDWSGDEFARELRLHRQYRLLEERGGLLYRLASRGYHHPRALPPAIRAR